MKANDILDKIKNIVGIELSDELNLTEVKLENGTILVAEEFSSGKSVFIKTEDEEVALPIGEYTLEDGKLLIVKEEGLIDSIVDAVEEDMSEKDVELENKNQNPENMEEEKKEAPEQKEEKMEKYVTKEEFTKAVEEIKNAIEEVKNGNEAKDEEKKEMNEEVPAKEELSAVAPSPVKHNPDAEVKQTFNYKISGNRETTTRDRVFNKIFNS